MIRFQESSTIDCSVFGGMSDAGQMGGSTYYAAAVDSACVDNPNGCRRDPEPSDCEATVHFPAHCPTLARTVYGAVLARTGERRAADCITPLTTRRKIPPCRRAIPLSTICRAAAVRAMDDKLSFLCWIKKVKRGFIVCFMRR